jgi:ribosomal protein L37E
MLNRPRHPQHTAAKRCAICGGKFGLVRHYSWRSQLCSKKCADRFKIRRESDRDWLHPFRAAWA